jgi:anti-sigma B factor antagonist
LPDGTEPFRLTVEQRGQQTWVTPTGELDLATQGEFRAQMVDLLVAGHVHLVLDLSEIGFIDSTGLGALIGIRRRAHALRGSLVLVCPPESVMRLFTIVGLEKVFDIRPDAASVLV